MDEICFDTILLKEAKNFDSYYKKHIIMYETISFLQEYDNLIFEKDFPSLFRYHMKKNRNELLVRINTYYKNVEKKLSKEHLLQQILDPMSEKNKDSWLKLNCFSILIVFDLLVQRINDDITKTCEKDLFKNEFISTNTRHLRKLIIDAKEFLMCLEKINGDNPKEIVGINRDVKGFDLNLFSNLLFNGIVDTSNFAFFLNLAFLLRDSLELRVCKALGVIDIRKTDGKPAKIASGDFIDFLFENTNIVTPKLNKSLIKKIHQWCNYHIHKGTVLYEWQLVLCYEYVRPFFQCGETAYQSSIYGSIQMSETYYKTKLCDDLKQFLVNKNPDNERIEIFLADKPEALLVK